MDVLLVDESPDLRLLLRVVLSSYGEFTIVGEATDQAEALEAAHQLRPDVVVFDVSTPNITTLEAIPRLIREVQDATIVVVRALHSQPSEIVERVRMGAALPGLVEKDASV